MDKDVIIPDPDTGLREPGVTPVVTVVIPTFQRPEFLRQALASCIAQDLDDPFDVIVVDNCPSGSARAAVEAAQDKITVRYVMEALPGVAHVRNTGIAQATGAFVAFLDDDQTASRGWLRALLAMQRRSGADVVHGLVAARLAADDIAHADLIQGYFTRTERQGSAAQPRRTGIGNCLVRRSLCSATAPFDPGMGLIGGEDTLFMAQLAARGAQFAYAADAAAYENVPPDRATLRYVMKRQFRAAQIHTYLTIRVSPPAYRETAKWTIVGMIQAAVFLPLALVLGVVRSEAWPKAALKGIGGLGKVLWMKRLIGHAYG